MDKICCFPACNTTSHAYDDTWLCLTDDVYQEAYYFCLEHAVAVDQKRQENCRREFLSVTQPQENANATTYEGQAGQSKEVEEAEEREVMSTMLTLEKLQAAADLFKTPPGIDEAGDLMFDVEEKLPEQPGEYFTRWQGFYVWMRFDVSGRAWYYLENAVHMQCFPSHWLAGGRQALAVGDLRRPERAPTC